MNEYISHAVGAPLVRTNPQRLNLIGNSCTHKDHRIFPPTDKCRACHDETLINQSSGELFKSQMTSSAKEVSTSSK